MGLLVKHLLGMNLLREFDRLWEEMDDKKELNQK